MKLEYLTNKLKTMTGLNSIDEYEEDLVKLVNAHNENQFSLYPRINLLAEQISLKLDNLYDRIIELLKYGKDSSSLEVYKLRYGEVEGEKRHQIKTDKTKQTLDKYIKKYGEIDGKIKYEEYCKSKSMSLDMFIRRYGEEEGNIKFREYWDTTGFGTSKRAFQKRHGEDWEKYYNDYAQSQGYNNTLDGKIAKYGKEEGTKKYEELNRKKSKSLSKESLIQKLLDSGATFSDIQTVIAERWDHVSLKSFISKYGEENGKIKYDDHVRRRKENNPICIEYYEKRNISKDIAFEMISNIQWEKCEKLSRFSKESLRYFSPLNEIFHHRGISCQYKQNEFGILLDLEEYEVYKQNRFFFYDFYVPDLKLIIEYHGERFHDDINYDETLNVSKDEIFNLKYNKDFYKKWVAEQRGFTVLILRSWRISEDLKNMFDFLNFTEEEKCKFL